MTAVVFGGDAKEPSGSVTPVGCKALEAGA